MDLVDDKEMDTVLEERSGNRAQENRRGSQTEILAALPDRALAAFIKQRLGEGVALRDIRFTDEYGAPAKVLESLAHPSSSHHPTRLVDWIQAAVQWTDGCRYLNLPNCFASSMSSPPTVDWDSELESICPNLYAMHLKDLRMLDQYTKLYKRDPGTPREQTLLPLPIDDEDGEGVEQPYWNLLDWEEVSTGSKVWEPAVLHTALASSLTTCSETVAGHIAAARSRLPPAAHTPQDWPAGLNSSCPLLLAAHAALPWYREGCAGVVLAGGAVASMLCPGTKPGDADLFPILPGSCRQSKGVSSDMALLCSQVITALQAAASRQRLFSYVRLRPRVITFFSLRCPFHSEMVEAWQAEHPGQEVMVHKVQIILRPYQTPAQVVHGFDVDACSVLYDGRRVWATERAAMAWHAGLMIASPVRQSPSYEHRLIKYSLRYGLHILVPGFPAATAQVITQYLDQAQADWLSAVRSLEQAGFYRLREQHRDVRDAGALKAATELLFQQHPELRGTGGGPKCSNRLDDFPLFYGRVGQWHKPVGGLGRLLVQLWLEGVRQELGQGRHEGRAAAELQAFLDNCSLRSRGWVSDYEIPRDLAPPQEVGQQCWFSWYSNVLSGRGKTTASTWRRALASFFDQTCPYAGPAKSISGIPHFQEGHAGLFSGSFCPLGDRDFFESVRGQLQFMFERAYLTALPVQFVEGREGPAEGEKAAGAAPGRAWSLGLRAVLQRGAAGAAVGALGVALQGGRPRWGLAVVAGAALHLLPLVLRSVLLCSRQWSSGPGRPKGKTWAELLPALAYD